MKWKHFISPSLCIKMLYIKNMKSWEKSMATASPAAAVFFWKFLLVFSAVLGYSFAALCDILTKRRTRRRSNGS